MTLPKETPMIERLALAMANSDAAMMDVPQLGSVEEFRYDSDRETYIRLARAVLTALREPTPEMLAQTGYDEGRNEAPLNNWQAMITAALNEGEGA